MTEARSFLFDAFLATLTVVMGLIFLPALIDRRAARAITRVWAQIALAALKGICGVSHEVRGAEFIPAGPAIVASGLTVIAALLCLALAELNSTASMGPIGAVGIFMANA